MTRRRSIGLAACGVLWCVAAAMGQSPSTMPAALNPGDMTSVRWAQPADRDHVLCIYSRNERLWAVYLAVEGTVQPEPALLYWIGYGLPEVKRYELTGSIKDGTAILSLWGEGSRLIQYAPAWKGKTLTWQRHGEAHPRFLGEENHRLNPKQVFGDSPPSGR